MSPRKFRWPPQREWIILLAMGNDSCYGGDILHRIQAVVPPEVSQGMQVYKALPSMEHEGLIEVVPNRQTSKSDRRRTYYRVSQHGRDVRATVLGVESHFVSIMQESRSHA